MVLLQGPRGGAVFCERGTPVLFTCNVGGVSHHTFVSSVLWVLSVGPLGVIQKLFMHYKVVLQDSWKESCRILQDSWTGFLDRILDG